MLKLVNLSKYYNSDGNVAIGLRNLNIEFNKNEIVAIVGESGSGKTTLLNVISGIDSYEEGEMFFLNGETSYYTQEDWDEYRKDNIGFVFQNYNLIDSYNVLQNVETVLLLRGVSKKEARKRALKIIDQVGLTPRRKTKAAKLSGGEKQRTALARALASDSKILVCDEPTGNLDSESGKQIMSLINEVAKNRLVVIVTHDFKIVEPYATRRVRLFDGEIVEDVKLKPTKEKETEEIVTKKEKINPLIYLLMALRNLLATPKKTIFSLLIYLTITVFIVSIYEVMGFNTNSYNHSYIYRFNSEKRIIANKNDNTPFTKSELENIKKMSNVGIVYENDYFLDAESSAYFVYDKSDYWMQAIYQNSELLSSDDLVVGALPDNENEIVICLPTYIDIEAANLIDIEVNYFENTYIIKGVTNKNFSSYGYGTIYGNRSLEGIVRLSCSTRFLTFTIESDNILDGNEINIYPIKNGSMPLEDNVIKLNIYLTHGSVISPEDEAKIIMSHFYGTKILEDYDVVLDIREQEWFEIIAIATETTLLNIINEDVYQISVLINDTYKMNETINLLKNMGYNTIVPSKSISGGDVNSEFFFTLFKIFMVFIALFSLYLISYLILSIITNSKQKDYTILRVLGVTKMKLNYIVILENITLAITSFILMIIIVLVVNNYHKLEILKIIKYNEVYKILFLLLAISVLAFFISIRYTKNLFKKSVNSSLRRE